MGAADPKWTVLPHGQPSAPSDDVLTVTGDIRTPIGHIPRRMTVIRLRTRELVVYSAMALDEEGMRAIEAFGRPAFLIVPGSRHRQDIVAWERRYPEARVIAPAGAADAVRKLVTVDATSATFDDPSVRLVEVAGMGGRELALEMGVGRIDTIVLNDIVFNLPATRGLGGWIRRLVGFEGTYPHIPGPIRKSWVDDPAALATQMRHWAAGDPARVIVSHGPIIDRDARGALIRIADDLAG